VNDNSITDSKFITESFNEYFVNIGGPSLASEASEEPLIQHTTNSYNNSNLTTDTIFHFHRINVENIILALMNLKLIKSTGLHKIPANVLRLSADIIAPSLTNIFNLSLDHDTCIYVDDWKRARVIPIYKSEDRPEM
jgi:hypothetical protein